VYGTGLPTLDHRHGVLLACVGSYFAIRLAQLLVSPVVPSVLADLSASRAAVGAGLSAMWLAYALVQLPSGVLGDRFGGRRVVLVALGLAACGALALAASPTLLAFGAAAAALGAGAGLYYNAATALLTAEFEAVGRAVGVHRIGGQAAGVVAPVAAGALAAPFGWRVAVASGAVVLGASFLAVRHGLVADPPVRPDGGPVGVDAGRLRDLVSRRPLVLAAGLAAAGEFAALATLSFLPTLLVQHHGLSTARAGLVFAGYFGLVALLQPVVGDLSDRIGRDATVAGAFLAGAAGYALLAGGPTPLAAVPAVALVAVGMSWGPPVQARALDALGTDERATGFGLVRTAYVGIGALGTVLVGGAADAGGWRTAAGLLAVVLALAAALPAALALRG
jgi:MFS family permease